MVRRPVCRANAMSWSRSAICDYCGHHGILHPGPNSTAECAVCAALAQIEDALALHSRAEGGPTETGADD